MIEEAIKEVLTHAASKPRESVLKINDGSERLFLFNDAEGKYEDLERVVLQGGTVSNIESFSALVLEEARRRGSAIGDPEHDGSFMTVMFNPAGATFSADDRTRLDKFTYKRQLSPQWKILADAIGVQFPHIDFVRLLQSLRPSISAYDELLREFRKVSFDSRTGIVSAPILTEGKSGNAITFEFEAKGGTRETALPSSFNVGLQYAHGSEMKYFFPVEVDASLVEQGEKKGIRFELIVPEMAIVEQQAIDDEIRYFRGETDSLPNLLTLLNF